MTEPGDWPPDVGQFVRVVFGRTRNTRMDGEVIGVEEYGGSAMYLVVMMTPSGERRAHLPDPIRCRLSDLEPGRDLHEGARLNGH